jgi:hypothetical protein
MSITAMADRLINVYRRTSLVRDQIAVSPSIACSRQPARPACIEVRLTGGAAGVVTVFGTVAGSSASEALAFPGGADALCTHKVFSALATPAFTTTGLAGGRLQAEAVGRDGSRVHATTAPVASDWPMRLDRSTARWPVPIAGGAQTERTVFYMDFTADWSPREGDVFVDQRTLEEWAVEGIPTLHGASTFPHHWEIAVRRREGTVGT